MPFNFLVFQNAGMLVWGATFLEVRESLPYQTLASLTGNIFMVGWLYAIGTLATALILYKLQK
jgi:hypothetical protein